MSQSLEGTGSFQEIHAQGGSATKSSFPFQLRAVAFFTVVVFGCDQIAFAEGVTPYEAYPIQSVQPATDPVTISKNAALSQGPFTSTIDFLSETTSPLSLAQNASQLNDSYRTYDQDGRLRSELNQDGNTVRHAYEGESVQQVIDQASAGDTVLVHAGTYHVHLVLKQGVDLKGEDAKTTILHGDYEAGAPVIRALGANRIEDLTVTGARDGPGSSSDAIAIEGDWVKVRRNLVTLNLSAGVYVHADAEHVLIEENIFSKNPVAVKDPKNNNVIRYNTIAGYEKIPAIRIAGLRYLSGRGFELSISDSGGNYSYYMEYSDDYGRTWRRAQNEVSAGIREDQKVLANASGKTSWVDDGSSTEADPLDVDVRWYRVVAAESFFGKTGIEILGGGAPLVQSNIIVHQETGAISGAVPGSALIAGNIFLAPGFADPDHGDYSIPETSSAYGLGALVPPALKNALKRASDFDLANTIQPLFQNGTACGYQVLYAEGSHEEFYSNGVIVFDQTAPELGTRAAEFFTNRPDYELVYTVDGIEKREIRHLNAGVNAFTIEAVDVFGNRARKTVNVTLDQAPPVATLKINNGNAETNARTVVIDISGQDVSPLEGLRFSVDGGAHWTDWESFDAKKVLTVPDGEGNKEIRCELRDAAGNAAVFSGMIRFVTAPSLPVVQFLSVPATTDPLYTLRYTVDGVDHQENWYLQPGENRLLVCASLGAFSAFAEHKVTLDQMEPALPAMPAIPALPQGLVSLTAANGLVLKYSNTDLVAIENPGSYTLFSPQFDAARELVAGVLLFNNGDKLLFQNGKPVYLLKSDGEKTVYNSDGTVACVLTASGKKTRFAYRLGASQKVVSILSFEEEGGVTSLYDEQGRPVWIKKTDGTAIRYQDGFLSDYTDSSGNIFRYETSVLRQGNDLTGYRSELVSVIRAGMSTPVPVADLLADPDAALSVKVTLEEKLSLSIEYDRAGHMQKAISGLGEVLELQNGLPVSYIDRSGEIFSVQNRLAEGRELLSVASGESGLEQVYDESGQLSGIRMSDGTLFRITGSSLERIELSDGSVLTWLAWNGSRLTGFTRTYADGSRDVYQDSKIVSWQDAQGNMVRYVNDQRRETYTEDGRIYSVTEYENAQGMTERLTELLSIQLPDNSWVGFENGNPVRYARDRNVPMDVADVPNLPEGRFFVSLIDLSGAQLRSLTVDQNGSIFSGELFFSDGTQYFIENNRIVKQVTATGQIMEFSAEDLLPAQPEPSVVAEPLTSEEAAYRDRLVETQLDYFMNGKGIHEGTGLPVDNYIGPSDRQSNYSQTTLVGFWAEILSAIASGDCTTTKMSREEALAKLKGLLETYQEVQRQAGWNGMVAFFTITPFQEDILDVSGLPTGQSRTVYRYTPLSDQVGFGDVLNLSVSLASVIGALNDIPLDPALGVLRDQILASANTILAAQEAGYATFYDPQKKRFRGAYARDPQTGVWAPVGNYYIDRVFNEFRTGMIWLVAKYPQYRDAFTNLDVAVRPFQTLSGDTADLAAPYDGGAFQMFWPLIHVDETRYPEFNAALRNFLFAQAEFANAHGTPGLLSAGDVPMRGYEGKIGLPGAAETDDVLRTDIGSIYGTAAAFPLAPHYALQFLKNLEAEFPGMRTPAGYVDAILLQNATRQDPRTGQAVTVTEAVYSDQYYGVDQASFILSLLRTSQDYFDRYLRTTGVYQAFDSLYRGMTFKLDPLTENNPEPPDFGQSAAPLYGGSNAHPDGLASGLIRQPAFVPALSDPEFGEGHVYNYLTPAGDFHHVEIEFGEGENLRRMNLQEYFLSPKHAGAATALLGGRERDLLRKTVSQGVFYTPGRGSSRITAAMDPLIGEVRHLNFRFESSKWPVGIWADYNGLDLSQYDFLSVPVKLGEDTPEKVRLKFEFKGMGEILVTAPLAHEWQYISIPVPKAGGSLNQLAISMQPDDGAPVAGDVYLGPISALKVRRSNDIDWKLLLGRTETDVRTLIQAKIAENAGNGQGALGRETLENFVVDSAGKLVRGVLKLADGGIQYFQNGQLVKWVFKNGRTVLFEEGLATFVIDLVRGKLETGRFYYDRTLRGKINSFVVQTNDSKKTFGADGQLQMMVEGGRTVRLDGGVITSVETDQGRLISLEFADDGALRRAHVILRDGTQFDIDQTGEQGTDVGNGVKLFVVRQRIAAIETPRNGRTYINYWAYEVDGPVIGADVSFSETVVNPVTGESRLQYRNMLLTEYLQRPERSVEREYLLREPPVDIIGISTVAGFSDGSLPAGEVTHAWKGNFSDGAVAAYQFRYQGPDNGNNPLLGMSAMHTDRPVDPSKETFLSITLKQDLSMDWNQVFQLTLKGPGHAPLYSFQLNLSGQDYKTFVFPIAYLSGPETEITLELFRQPEGVGKTGTIYIKDLSYVALSKITHPLWEDRAGISMGELQGLRIEAKNLASVGTEIASGKPLVYSQLAEWLDTPALLHYSGTSSEALQLTDFNRFDGSRFELEGQNVRRVTLPDGTVNEYASTSQNSAQGTILGPGENTGGAATISYNYGALRRITQSDGREYELSYEFAADGKEITVFKDALSGEERRFKEGKLLSAGGAEQLETRYVYQNGEVIGAELTYRNRILNSTQYSFNGGGTQVTDERGTTWFYDANGNLIKHMTREGFLYEYSEYTHELPSGATLVTGDYKNVLFNTPGLRAVRLKGYEAPDGSWIVWDGTQGSEVHLVSGAQGVNLVFDAEQRIRDGQIQFPDGLLLEIENYIPVRGRFANGQLFEYILSPANDHDLVQAQDGSYLGFRFRIGGRTFTYNTAGELTRAESESGITDLFTCARDAQGNPVTYTHLERRQIAFGGVPFPKEVELIAGPDQKIIDSGKEVAAHAGDGFLVGVYKEATNQWDVYAGSFASAGDRAGLRNFLSEIKTGDSVSAVVSDAAFSRAGEEIFALFEGLGAGGIRQAAAGNSPWSFFGNENLSAGQGYEKTGAASFSTVTETSATQSITAGTVPVFENAPMFFGMSPAVATAYSGFLRAYQPLEAARDMQSVTVYDSQDEIVFSKRLDGISSYYEHGKVRETFNEGGELLSVHEYSCPAAGCHSPEDMTLSKITLVKGRQDFEAQAAPLTEQIEQTKFDALYRLAWQDDVARARIRENVDVGVAQINSQISSLESQRFRTEKQCHRVLFWKSCKEYTYEVPGVQSAINELASQRADLIRTGEEQLAVIPGAIAAKKLEIEQATAAKMLELEQQKESFLLDILHQEMEPILTDFYRRILGRDASKQEFDSLVNRFKIAGRIDIAVLSAELQNSAERAFRRGQKDAIVQGVRAFLENYLVATAAEKTQLLATLNLEGSEAVALDAVDVAKVLAWLESRDLHFGQSAFLSLKEMLASKGTDVPMETLGRETILIDVLTGVINKFTEGDLVISMFAMDRTAAIHEQDFASVKYSYQDLLTLYKNICPDLQSSCSLRLIAHIGEDHFVVVKRVTDTEVTYEETGKGMDGEDVTITKEQFLKVWIAKDNEGYLMAPEDQAIQAKKLSDQEAMKVRGAFWFIFFFVVSAFLTVASMVVSVFSPTLGKILGYAALVAGILGIVASLGSFIVSGVKAVFSSIAQNGIFGAIKQGLAYIGTTLWESVKSVGRFILKGFEFLKGGFSGGFGSLGAGITNMKEFLFDGAKILANGTREFTFGQIVARQLVAAGLNMGVSKGLEGLGLDPRLCQLAGAFVGGGFLGIGQSGASFIRSGLQQFALQGVSELGLRLGLAPPITGALSVLASASLTSFFSGNFSLKPFTEIVPYLASRLTLGGLEMLGRSMGLNPTLTQLLGLPISSIVGNITARFSGTVVGYRSDGTPIYVTSPYDAGSLWDSIKNSLINGIQQVGFSFAGATSNPLFGSLLSGDILNSIAGTLNADNLFGGILDILKSAILAPFNLVNGVVQTTLQGLRDFKDLILEKGLVGAFESLASAIFSRSALEKILGLGGISNIVNSTARNLTTLANGQQCFEQKLDGSTSLFFDLLGNFIGKKENGVTQLGTFGVNSAGKWALLAGSFIADVVGGYVFAGEVNKGQLKSGKLYRNDVLIGEFSSPENDGAIIIDGENPDAQQFDAPSSFWNMVFRFLPYAMEFVFRNGLLQQVSSQVNSGSGSSGSGDPEKPFFILANGVGNPTATGLPDYINNLTSDLHTQSAQQIAIEDIISPPLYNSLFGGGATDSIKDILHWIAESNTPFIHLDLVGKIQIWMNLWQQAIAARPVVGVGFSGGFEPLVESLVGTSYNVTSFVSLAGIIGSVAGISTEIVNLIITVADQIESGTVNGLRGFLDTLFSKIPVVGDVVQLATSIVGFVNEHSIGLAFDTLKTALMTFLQALPPALPPVISPSAELLVNLYGTEDILYKLNLVGAKTSIADFTPDDPLRRLFNIEIVGATHSGYMRRDDSSLDQPAVNVFVTNMILHSQSEEDLSAFLNQQASSGKAVYDRARKVWVVYP